MKQHTILLFFIFLSACKSGLRDTGIVEIDSAKSLPIDSLKNSSVAMDSSNADYATYFVLVADTSLNYSILNQRMFELKRKYHIPIDTMGRYYNTSKNLIALPDNDEDELYAGEYFPRRFPSENLSLEYLHIYQDNAREKTIALITGIYEKETSADSALAFLQKTEKGFFKIKANMYVGCMH